MEINKNNYEPYFVDYLEGKLDEKLVDGFIEFLQQNPEIRKELSLFEPVSLVPEEVGFPLKHRLYKEKYDAEKTFNQAVIQRLEGDIPREENKRFAEYLLSHPEKEKEAAIFYHTKLKPDKSIVFDKKRELYRRPAGRKVLMWPVRIAAVVVLALIFYLLNDRQATDITVSNQLVPLEKNIPPQKPASVVEGTVMSVKLAGEDKKKVQKAKKQIYAATPDGGNTPKANKSPHSGTKGSLLGNNGPAFLRYAGEVPAKMGRIPASLDIAAPVATLAAMDLNIVEGSFYEERLIADVVKEKIGADKVSFDKIKKVGLNLFAGFTKDNLSYSTNNEGRVTEINYDSRLLAFSIPTNSGKAKE